MAPYSPVQQATQATNFASFVGGINAASPLYGMPQTDCIYTYNMMPTQYGMKVRNGSAEWANGMGGDSSDTIMPYNATTPELFAATNVGIYDVTTQGDTSPTQVVPWSFSGDPAGQCSFINFKNDAGNFLLVADEANGYHVYDGATWEYTGTVSEPTLTLPAGLGGGNVTADAVFVMEWKQRLWFIIDGYDDAFYLPANAISGTLTQFRLGNKLEHGGSPVGLWKWTLDAGDGVDDNLVALGSQGDVLVYQGIDPSLPAEAGGINLIGSYYIGQIPVGRRVALSYGGDVVILSTRGVVSLAERLRGAPLSQSTDYLTYRIERLVSELMLERRNSYGWGLYENPRDSFLMITTPVISGSRPIQFVMDTTTKAWGIWRDIPVTNGATWQDIYFLGWADSPAVYQHSGFTDNVNIDSSGNDDIEFSLLGSFLDFGSPATYKKIEYLRPSFRGGSVPSYAIKAVYDYEFEEIFFSGTGNSGIGGIWEPAATVTLWDEAVWSGGLAPSFNTIGSLGMGRMAAIALKGKSRTRMELVDVNVLWSTGGTM